jgi:acid phosphatase (class A)
LTRALDKFRNNPIIKRMNLGLNAADRLRERSVGISLMVLWLAAPLFAAAQYLAPGRPDGIALLPPPPMAGSAEQAADLAATRAVFKGRTAAEESRALNGSPSIFAFAPAIGPKFQVANFPKTEALWEGIRRDMTNVINIAKDHWKRPRPFVVDPDLSLSESERSFSYPSGHSARGMVQALVLAELFPEKREALMAIGFEIGWDRVRIAKHYPTDVYAGRVLGKAIVRELLANPAFQRDLAEAKAEVKAVQNN